MNKIEFINRLKEEAGFTTYVSAAKALDTVIRIMTEELTCKGGVTLTGFGSFKLVDRSPRIGRNPRTGERVDIPARKSIKFSGAKALREKVR